MEEEMERNTKQPKPIPVGEALEYFDHKISREAFYRKLKSGELPSYRFGRKILVDVDEILAAMRVKNSKWQ